MVGAAQRIDNRQEEDLWQVPDAPIELSIPHRSRTRGAARHFGFMPFFAKKPWPVVQEYIKHYSQPGELVCDPFAGSGVTPVEALVLGRRAVAGDINPVARFITHMTAIAPVDLSALRKAYAQLEEDVRGPIEALDKFSDVELAHLLSRLEYPQDPIPGTVRRAGAATVDQLHTPRQLVALTLLRDAIARMEDPVARDLLRLTLIATVRYCNRMYILPTNGSKQRSPYRGDVGFLRRFSYSLASSDKFHELPVWSTFERRFRATLAAKDETNQLIDGRYDPNSFQLTGVPAASIHEITGESEVDYCLTDPPYSNEIHFLDLSTLWAAWLGLDITDETRHAELLLRGTTQPSRDLFAQQFADVAESIARALKPDRWLTLVYKHRDLSLWQTVVGACEESGLRFVNATWQDVKIRSTRQVESPNLNPTGDMYLNFRKMTQNRFERLYGMRPPAQLPTRANYVEHEVERLIVAYLGADIGLLTAGVVQRLLNSGRSKDFRANEDGLRADISKVLKSSRFAPWQTDNGKPRWIMAPDSLLDASLDATDRARYYVFDYLREHGEATEGELRKDLLTRLAGSRVPEVVTADVPELLRNVGNEVSPRRWLLDIDKVLGYRQLRLVFQPSLADDIRQRVERLSLGPDDGPLRVDLEGMALLRDRLREANAANRKFETDYGRLLEVLQSILLRVQTEFAGMVERVMAVGDWARYGIDLRNLPYDEVVFLFVVRASERPFSLYLDVADRVFSDLDDAGILAQFRIETLSEWEHTTSVADSRGMSAALGVPLLVRG